jgi:hypothetical protein
VEGVGHGSIGKSNADNGNIVGRGIHASHHTLRRSSVS